MKRKVYGGFGLLVSARTYFTYDSPVEIYIPFQIGFSRDNSPLGSFIIAFNGDIISLFRDGNLYGFGVVKDTDRDLFFGFYARSNAIAIYNGEAFIEVEKEIGNITEIEINYAREDDLFEVENIWLYASPLEVYTTDIQLFQKLEL